MRLLLLLCLLISSTSALLSGDGVLRQRLFHIDRSKDPGIVCYDVILVDGKIRAKDPIDVYWRQPHRGNIREELNWIERWQGYGIDVDERWGTDSLDFTMRADGTHIRVKKRDGRWVAHTLINKIVAQLTSVYVVTDESGWFPEVLEIHMKGRVVTDRTRVVEIKKPD